MMDVDRNQRLAYPSEPVACGWGEGKALEIYAVPDGDLLAVINALRPEDLDPYTDDDLFYDEIARRDFHIADAKIVRFDGVNRAASPFIEAGPSWLEECPPIGDEHPLEGGDALYDWPDLSRNPRREIVCADGERFVEVLVPQADKYRVLCALWGGGEDEVPALGETFWDGVSRRAFSALQYRVVMTLDGAEEERRHAAIPVERYTDADWEYCAPYMIASPFFEETKCTAENWFCMRRDIDERHKELAAEAVNWFNPDDNPYPKKTITLADGRTTTLVEIPKKRKKIVLRLLDPVHCDFPLSTARFLDLELNKVFRLRDYKVAWLGTVPMVVSPYFEQGGATMAMWRALPNLRGSDADLDGE